MAEQKIIEGEDLRKMQLLQLDMLVELDRVCRQNNIKYQIGAGTLLGAVRHKGFIPWDDDVDVFMLREEYEKFKRVSDSLNKDICFFQDHDTDEYYRWGYGKLRRTGTKYIRVGQENMKCKNGVFIDVFPLDDVPISIIGQMLQDFRCFCIRKIMWSEVGKDNTKFFMKIWYSLLSKIPINFAFSRLQKDIKRSRNNSLNRVRVLCFTTVGKLNYKHKIKERYSMPKEWFKTFKTYSFENKALIGVKDYDSYLTYCYGDYMELPPVDKRVQNSPVSDYSF